MTTWGKYECGKVIGEGSYSQVRLATDSTSGKRCALKLFKSTGEDAKKNLAEAEILESLNHKNVIRVIDYCADAEYKKDMRTKKVSFIATEIAEKGALFDYMQAARGFSEPLARAVFSQILEAIEYMHSEGIWHRDIKGENVFLDADFGVKIGDMGFATRNITESSVTGTNFYMAPEVHSKQEYNCKAVDVFALGVLLFSMVIGKYPFVTASDSDCKFKLLMLNKSNLFWKTSVRGKEKLKDLSPEFIELVNLMLSPDPMERPTVSEIIRMKWFTGKTCTPDQVKSELANLEERIIKNDEEFVAFH